MRIGVPKEVKVHEYRVGLTPDSVRELTLSGHQVIVESQAGIGIDCSDDDYAAAGAKIAESARRVFDEAELIVKVKEPQATERLWLKPGQVLFSYLHLAPDPEQARDLVASKAVCIAYETVVDAEGRLPLLAPMSKVAGRLAIQAGAWALEAAHGGRGILLGGVPGVAPARVTVIGGGVVGENAIMMALGMGADVTVLDTSVAVLDRLAHQFAGALKTIYASRAMLEEHVLKADLVIGAVLVVGAEAPKVVTAEMVRHMKRGAVLVDVAIDQGGCFETSRPTTHAEPTYIIDGIVHYCVANMPGATPRTSTYALNNATLPYVMQLANQGYRAALGENPGFREGLNICFGMVTHKAVAESLGYPHTPAEVALAT
jgi:alanine dehydrogenase